MEEVLATISLVLLFTMIIPANGFPIALLTTVWTDSWVGKSLMLMASSLAGLIDASAIFYIMQITDGAGAYFIQVLVFLAINAGLWSMFIVILMVKRKAKREGIKVSDNV